MLIIGEKINATIKSVGKAIEARDAKFLQNLAKLQQESGAQYIDVNVSSTKGRDYDKESMEWAVERIQEVVDVPLAIDTPDHQVLEAGLRRKKHKESMINSIDAEQERLEAVLPIAKEFDSNIIALAMGKEGIPSSTEGRLKACEKVAESAQKYGIALEKLYFDPLVLSIATDTSQGIVTLKTLKEIKSRFPEAKTALGLSNISFGLPKRPLINRSFLLVAIYLGLDSAILDPLDKKLMSVIKAGELVLGKDNYCKNYLKAYREGLLDP